MLIFVLYKFAILVDRVEPIGGAPNYIYIPDLVGPSKEKGVLKPPSLLPYDQNALKSTRADDHLKGTRVFVINNHHAKAVHSRHIKGRYGYVLYAHPSKSTAFVSLDGASGSKAENEHEIELQDLIGVYVSFISIYVQY